MGFIDDGFYKVHDKGEISTSERNTVYSTSKTKTALKILNDDQLKDIKKRLFKGGFQFVSLKSVIKYLIAVLLLISFLYFSVF